MDHQDPRAELKPCPFCGNEDVALKYERDEDCILCSRCFTEGPYCDSGEEAIAAWNRRSLAASVPAQPVAFAAQFQLDEFAAGSVGCLYAYANPSGQYTVPLYAAPVSQEVAMEQLQREAQERGQYGPLKRGATGVCSRSECICEREGLGDECIWLRPTLAAQAVAPEVGSNIK